MSALLKSVAITDYRSIRGNINVPLNAPVVLIHGPNGSGKTSILSAIELALTGAIPSLERIERDYKAHLIHKEATRGRIELKVEDLPSTSGEASLSITSAGTRGAPLLPERLASFYSERCYLPQSVLGRLLEFYQSSDARQSDSPLTLFVKDLLGLDQLDALVDGLHDAGDIRRLRGPVPAYAAFREEIQSLTQTINADDAALTELKNQIDAAEGQLRDTLSVVDGDLVEPSLSLRALQSRLNRNAEEEQLIALARVRRNLDAARNEWQSVSVTTTTDERRRLEREATTARDRVDRWRSSTGQELETLVDEVVAFFPDLPSPTSTDPEFARQTALRAVMKEYDRCVALLTQDEADTKRLAELDQDLSRASARNVILDQQISSLASDAGALAQALVGIAPHIHDDDCPVCGRNFKEVSKRSLSAHLSRHIASLTENAGRLQALSQEKSSITASIAQISRERAHVAARQISDSSRNEVKERRARLDEIKRKLEGLANKTQEGHSLINAAAQASRNLDALRSRDLRINNFRATLLQLATALAIENYGSDDPVDKTLAFFQTTLIEKETRLSDLQRRRQRASSDLSIVISVRAKFDALSQSIAGRRSRLVAITEAKAQSDERISVGRDLARAAREVRTSIVRRIFNDSLNLIWRDLFVRLAPEEPFVPAFALPDTTSGPVEALLETIYRSGGKGGNPRAMLSAGNLNTAALTLFLSLHLSVSQELPWLVIDDPVQSMDEVHIAQFAALLRTLSKSHGRQIILAVHERSLFDYLALELSPAFSDDRLITIELGQAPDGKTICNYEPLTWSPDPAFAAA